MVTLTHGPKKEAWKDGWYTDHMTAAQAPRWTLSHAGRHDSLAPVNVEIESNAVVKLGVGYRSTWVEKHVLDKFTPGPGHYRTQTDKRRSRSTQSDVNITKTTKEAAPRWTQSKTEREVVLPRLKKSSLKPSYISIPVGKSTDVKFTPGPGEYTQLTYFGGASGPSRKPYF